MVPQNVWKIFFYIESLQIETTCERFIMELEKTSTDKRIFWCEQLIRAKNNEGLFYTSNLFYNIKQ